MKYLYRVRSQRDALCVFPGYKWGNGDQKSCHQKPNTKATILYLSAHFPSSLPAGLPPPTLWRLSQGQYLSKTNPKTWKKTAHSKGFIIEALQEGSICLCIGSGNNLFWKNPYFVHGRFPCKQMTGRSQTSSQIFSSTHQPSQPRSPAPPCWIWSGCTWMGTESSAPLFPAGARSLWLGRYVHSLRWTRRGEPSQILYSRDFPRWCWLCSPQWLACTRSHPGKSKARTLTQQAELKLQCYAVPLTLQFFPLRKTKHLYTNREEEMGWII